jgi:hypothetical protein
MKVVNVLLVINPRIVATLKTYRLIKGGKISRNIIRKIHTMKSHAVNRIHSLPLLRQRINKY